MPLPSTYVEGFHDKTAVENMRYRELPHYGKVSILSYGAAGIGVIYTTSSILQSNIKSFEYRLT